MQYILDTGFFVLARDYYPETFPSFWEKLDQAVEKHIVSSVKEVKKEIEKYGGGQDHLLQWIKMHDIFPNPSKEEQESLIEIMKRFPQALPRRKQSDNAPWADPFVIAKAWQSSATVVTREQPDKLRDIYPNNPIVKIPDICQTLGVRWMPPQEFMQEQDWSF